MAVEDDGLLELFAAQQATVAPRLEALDLSANWGFLLDNTSPPAAGAGEADAEGRGVTDAAAAAAGPVATATQGSARDVKRRGRKRATRKKEAEGGVERTQEESEEEEDLDWMGGEDTHHLGGDNLTEARARWTESRRSSRAVTRVSVLAADLARHADSDAAPESMREKIRGALGTERLAKRAAAGVTSQAVSGSVETAAEDMGLAGQVRRLRSRITQTARSCAHPGCTSMHFCDGAYCVEHSNRGGTAAVATTGTAVCEKVANERRKAPLRIAMEHAYSCATQPTQTDILAATALLTPEQLNNQVTEQELGLLKHQFNLLDHNRDAIIDTSDVRALILRVDPAGSFVSDETAAAKIADANIDCEPTMTFQQYVRSLLILRVAEQERGFNISSAFWRLRSAIALRPDRPLRGWLLKRGHFLIAERFNAWKRRFFVETHHTLQYWDAEPGLQEGVAAADDDPFTDAITRGADLIGGDNLAPPATGTASTQPAVLKGEISLLEIMHVDFSPKTVVPQQKDLVRSMQVEVGQLVVFKLTTWSGRRFTLAALHDDAIQWCASLVWHVAHSRAAQRWRMEFGSEVRQRRDVSTATESMAPDVAASTDTDTSTSTYTTADDTGGSSSLNPARRLYSYALSRRNAIRAAQYGVRWDSKAEARECAVCAAEFRARSARKSYKKHHCRSCGRVCCTGCSQMLYYRTQQKPVRTCVDCIQAGGPSQDRVLQAMTTTATTSANSRRTATEPLPAFDNLKFGPILSHDSVGSGGALPHGPVCDEEDLDDSSEDEDDEVMDQYIEFEEEDEEDEKDDDDDNDA